MNFPSTDNHNLGFGIVYDIDGTGHDPGGASITSAAAGGFSQVFCGRVYVPVGKTAHLQFGHYVNIGSNRVDFSWAVVEITRTTDHIDATQLHDQPPAGKLPQLRF